METDTLAFWLTRLGHHQAPLLQDVGVHLWAVLVGGLVSEYDSAQLPSIPFRYYHLCWLSLLSSNLNFVKIVPD
jgi:hypothetical protein